MTAGTFQHHSASRHATKTLIELSDVLGNGSLDVQLGIHALKINFDRRLHILTPMYVPAMQTARYIAISDSGFVIVASVSKKTGGAPDSNYPQGRLKLLDKNATIYRDIVPKIVAAEPNAVVTSKN